MDSPRDRDGFDDRGPGDWQEPEHLGTGGASSGSPAEPPAGGPVEPGGSTAWQPPGWDLPTVEPERPATQPAAGPWSAPTVDQRQDDAAATEPPARGGGLFGPRGRRTPTPEEHLHLPASNWVDVQTWAARHGWVPSDGSGPQDASLADLVRSAPVRPSREDRPGNVVRGRGLGLDLVAFDVVYTSGRYAVPRWAVTAAPVLGELPGFRLSPARFWKHRIGGLVQIPSGDPEFDTRWVLLAAGDGPQVRRLVADPVVRQLLLGSDDGDELWSAAGFVAAIRPDGHRPQLIEHQARLLAAVVGALAASA